MFSTKKTTEVSASTAKRILGNTVGQELTKEEQQFVTGGMKRDGTRNETPAGGSDVIQAN